MDEATQKLMARRPYKAYCAKTGDTIGFDTPLDLAQALSMGHVVLSADGGAPIAADPTRNYGAMDSESLRKLCINRGVKGYLVLNRGQQVEALQELDAQEAAALAASKPAKKKG